jgi:hypothetical protein
VPLAGIDVSPSGGSVSGVGATFTFSATGRDPEGNPLETDRVRWRSLNPFIATIDSLTGEVVAVASGQVTVAAEADGFVGYALLTVSVPEVDPVSEWNEMRVAGDVFPDLNHLWGFTSRDVYAVGDEGAILHFDGTSWSRMRSGTSENLEGIWGVAPDDIWALGSGVVLHFDGVSWTSVPGTNMYGTWPLLTAVGGSSAGDVKAVGYFNIYHFDGTNWSWWETQLDSKLVSTRLHDVWIGADGRGFAVGEVMSGGGRIFHWDGDDWTFVTSTSRPLRAVWGSSSNDVHAVGFGQMLHLDGTSWRQADHPHLPGYG